MRKETGRRPANCSRGPSAGDPGAPTRPSTSGHPAHRRNKRGRQRVPRHTNHPSSAGRRSRHELKQSKRFDGPMTTQSVMTSSLSAPGAPVLRSRRTSPEPALPSCSWTRTHFRRIRFCRLIPSIRQVSTSSTRSVSATQSARWRRRRTSCGCERTTPSSTSSFPTAERSTVLADGGSTVSCKMRQRLLASRSLTERG